MYQMPALLPYLNITKKITNGAACRNRTDHLMITNQLLYQMS